MNNHELKLYDMKTAIFELFSNPTNRLPLETSLEKFKKHFMECFEIEFVDILVYENNRFVHVLKNGHAMKHTGYAEEQMISINPLYKVSLISHDEEGTEFADDSLIIRNNQQSPLGAILFKASDMWHEFASSPNLKDLKAIIGTYFGQLIQMERITEKEKTYRRLFEMAELFNSTMESTVILDEMMEAVSDSFSLYDIQLMLSQEQKGITKVYRLFDYLNERGSAVEAFLSGDLTIENATDLSASLMNAPIRGRQGIYGVLQIKAPKDTVFTFTEKDFIKMITNAAGRALENASLYEQSHRLVDELQLVNEASRKLNNNLDLDEVISYLKIQFMKAFRPNEMAFVFYDESSDYSVSVKSTRFFDEEIGKQLVETMSIHFRHGEEAVFDANMTSDAIECNMFKSRVALPIVNRGDLLGFVILLHKEEYFFSFENFKLMRSLISHSSLAISNIRLRDQLQELVDRDNLTKLFTRRYLDKVVTSSIEAGKSGLFLLLDVDDFKKVNDAHGHTTGDIVLQQISSFILMKVDGKGVASRWGGEEIAIYLSSFSIEEGVEFAKSLVESIPSVTEPCVTVSMGLTYWDSENNKSYNELFQSTDKALYFAKNNGKNQLIINGVASASEHC